MKSLVQTAWQFGKRLKGKVSEDDLSGKAAEMAYRFFLAIFPFFIFLAALGGFVASSLDVDNPTQEVMDMIGDALPSDTASVVETQLEGVLNDQSGGLLSVGIIGTIVAASGAITALMKNLNAIYDVEESRGFVMKYVISLGLTLLSAGVIVLAFVIFFVGQIYGPDLAGEIGLEGTAASLISLGRWPAALILTMLAVGFLYWLAPNTEHRAHWISPGALFFGVSWLIATFLFGLYVSNFGSYNATYGALGAIVILLIWFYLTSFLLLLGAAINQLLTERFVEEGLQETRAAARLEAQRTPQRETQPEVIQPPRTDQAPAGQQQVPRTKAGLGLAGIVGLLVLIGALRNQRAG